MDLSLFDKWNEVKKGLEQKSKVEYFKERQIWWCGIGQNLGSESYGKGKTFTRPILIFKKLSTDLFLAIPLTSKNKTGTWYVEFSHQGKQVTAMLSQMRICDKKRLVYSMGEIDDQDFSKIKKGFIALYCG